MLEGSGRILFELMVGKELDTAEYYVVRGKPHGDDETLSKSGDATLTSGTAMGHLPIVKGLVDAWADVKKADKIKPKP